MWSEIGVRVRAIFGKREMEAELDEELRFHFEKAVEKNVAAGMSAEEARRQARLKFGGEERVREECREARGVGMVEALGQDLRFGARMLRKSPAFTLAAVVTLALGIGASTAVFSVVNGILLKPLPYAHPERVLVLWWRAPMALTAEIPVDRWPWSIRQYVMFPASSEAIEANGAFKADYFNLTGRGEPKRLNGLRASAGFFEAIGAKPALGRGFYPEEDKPGNGFVAVLGDRLWRESFGADPGVVGKAMTLNGRAYTIVGVMPPGFDFPRAQDLPISSSIPGNVQLWVPLELPPVSEAYGPSELTVIARMRPGVTLGRATSEMRLFGGRLEQAFPASRGWNTPSVVGLSRQVVGDTERPLLLILGAVGVVLLIATSNVASLVLGRSLARKQEFTLRGALGAGRGRLVRQVLTESVLLAGCGGAAGVALAEAGVHFVKIFGPATIGRLQEVSLDPRVMVFAVGVTLLTGILFGLGPALGSSRGNLAESLNEGGQRTSGGAAQPKLRNALLVGQVALALVLVISAGLLVRTFYGMLAAGGGFNPTRVLTFQLTLPSGKYPEVEQMAEVYGKALRAVREAPGVEEAGLASEVPMGGPTDGTAIRIPEHPVTDVNAAPYADYSFASPGYLGTIGAVILRGRDFTDADDRNSEPVAIINEAMAKRYFAGEDPVGKQVGVGAKKFPVRTIVGVIANVKHNSLRDEPEPEMYVPYTQNEIKIWPSMQTMQVALRAKGNPGELTEGVRKALAEVDADLPVANVATLGELVDESMAVSKFTLFLVGSFGGLALVLAMIGMYGAISYAVEQRTREFGIRMALGATPRDVLGMVLGQGARLAAAGIACGLVTAAVATRTMEGFLYGVRATDPATFAGVAAALMGVALAACYLPARKATRVDPLTALRYE